jgi:hypothetical protein
MTAHAWPIHCSCVGTVENAMKTSTAATLAALVLPLGVLFSPAVAHAQGDHPEEGHAQGEPAQGRDASPPPLPVPPTPPVPSGPPCRLAEHGGVGDADASTTAQLVCSALSRAGAPPSARYRVAVGRLGSVIILSVALEGDTFGSTADTREMRLDSIEAVPGAAPRIANALVHGTVVDDIEAPLPSGKAPEPLRPATSSSAKVRFALGMMGMFPPLDRSVAPAAGVDLELHADLGSLQIVTDVRLGGDDSDRTVGIVFAEFSMGGRYFMSDADFSPFIGGGFAWSVLSLTDNVHNDFDGSHNGLGSYGELGLEIGRTHHTRLAFGVRLDLPFYSLTNNESFAAPPQTAGGGFSQEPPLQIGTLYYAPLSLEIRVTF